MTNTSRENYTHISENLVCPEDKNIEYCQELQKIADLCCEFSDNFISKSSENSPHLEKRSFRDYLIYVVTGRIINLSYECLEKGKNDEPVLNIASQMGEHIHTQLGIKTEGDKETSLKDILSLAKTAFEIIDPETIFEEITISELNLIRKIGSDLVPHYSMGESSATTFILD